MVLEIGEHKYSMDGYLKSNLDIFLNEAIPNNWDGLFIIFGREGSGKTTIAAQSALYCDHSFDIDKCVFSAEQFKNKVDDVKPESAILWDEAITGANASDHARQIQSDIISKLTMIRKRKLKLFLCFPYLDMLRRYFVNRCLASLYVYARSFTDRGHFYFYNDNQTEKLYGLMKNKYRSIPKDALKTAKRSFYGTFTKYFPLDEKEYEKRKDEASRLSSKKGNIWKNRFIETVQYCRDEGIVAPNAIAKKIGIDSSNLYRMIG